MIFKNIDEIINNNFDVVIVGSGPAGISTALKLEEKKIKTLILEAGSEEYSEKSQKFYSSKILGDQITDLETRIKSQTKEEFDSRKIVVHESKSDESKSDLTDKMIAGAADKLEKGKVGLLLMPDFLDSCPSGINLQSATAAAQITTSAGNLDIVFSNIS